MTEDTQDVQPDVEKLYRQPWLWEMSRYEGDYLQRLRARTVAAMIDPAAESVLDVGCGNGFITSHIRANRVVGLDPSLEALSHFHGEAVLGSADALPFEDRSFEAVVCTEVLEHLDDAVFAKAIRELARVARHSLLIGVPYRETLTMRTTQYLKCGTRYHVNYHPRSFRSAESVASLFPGLETTAVVLLGARSEIRSRAFQTMRYWLLGPQISWVLLCPKCGSSSNASYKELGGKKLRQRIIDGLAWRMPRIALPLWILVLLSRAWEER